MYNSLLVLWYKCQELTDLTDILTQYSLSFLYINLRVSKIAPHAYKRGIVTWDAKRRPWKEISGWMMRVGIVHIHWVWQLYLWMEKVFSRIRKAGVWRVGERSRSQCQMRLFLMIMDLITDVLRRMEVFTIGSLALVVYVVHANGHNSIFHLFARSRMR